MKASRAWRPRGGADDLTEDGERARVAEAVVDVDLTGIEKVNRFPQGLTLRR